MAARLGVDGVHVITGHTHRGGPNGDEAEWPLPAAAASTTPAAGSSPPSSTTPARPPSPYWPGTVTWVEDSGPPRRVQLLLDRSHAEMVDAIERHPL